MKKTILMTLAALGLAGLAQADYSVTLDDYYYQGMGSGNASWVYIWTAGDGSATSGSNWGYLQNKNQQALSSSNAQTPIKFDPGFIGFLESKGLSEWEIEYCCLYAIGLKGKDIGFYINKKRHYNDSSGIRSKLGLGEHDTNLGIFLKKMLSETD